MDFWRVPLLTIMQVARVLLIWITGMLLMGVGLAVVVYLWPQPASPDRDGLSVSLVLVVSLAVVAALSAAVTVAVGRAIRRFHAPARRS